MIFMAATCEGRFIYHGAAYDLKPLSPPEIDPNHILAAASGLERAILDEHPGLISAVQFETDRIPGFPRPLICRPEEIPPGSRILLMRAGGIGDLIMLTPAIREMKSRLKDSATIILATYADYADIFCDLADRIIPYPVTLSQLLQDADYFVEFDDPKDLFETGEMTDYYLDCLGMDPQTIGAGSKKPCIPAAMASSDRIKQALKRIPGRIRVFYAGGASDRIRYLPRRILEGLATSYPEISFIVPGKSDVNLPNIFTIDTSDGLSEYVTAIAGCDAVISTDSSAYHIAAAFDIPALVFFGPISSAIRTGYYPKVVALDADYRGETCTSPCGISTIRRRTRLRKPLGKNQVTVFEEGTVINTFSGRTFSYDPEKGCPESCALNSSTSPCIEAFTDERVLAGFKNLLEHIES